LRYIAIHGYQCGSEGLGGGGIPMEKLHKQFQENVVEPDATDYNEGIPKKLYAAFERRGGKHNVLIHQEAVRKAN
jgi:hypothetical protein